MGRKEELSHIMYTYKFPVVNVIIMYDKYILINFF